MSETYRITIQIGENKLELESHDPKWIESKQKELATYLESIPVNSKPNKPKTESHTDLGKSGITMTINEYYRKYCNGMKVTTDLAVFFIYYLNWIEKKKDISTNDIKVLFTKVGIPKANTLNYSDILSKAKKRALLNFIDNAWSLTITGEDFVLNKIQDTK
ncbi:hypothetical protein [Leptospira perdikensis]|uniref:Uncharacterized protein n=1 Tax=Leptospira perdikensis TaxID=2484948 RepID=A0A4R9JCQ3_9LEPT|nr:hypothetical protein [Leptospira perdikensis]TGL35942.1 hypothetical protein EHQ49_16735 [Leptospira perdikensis]